MNRTLASLIMKFVLTFAAAAVAFLVMTENPASWVFVVALVGTALNYLLGDLVVLPKYGNIIASLGDGILAALVAYVTDLYTAAFNTTYTALAVFFVIVTVVEYFFHRYLLREEKVAP